MGVDTMRKQNSKKLYQMDQRSKDNASMPSKLLEDKGIQAIEAKALHDLANSIESPELQFKMWQMSQRG